MKTPIAMRCTQDQFDAVKPKLEKLGLNVESISNFDSMPFLINNREGRNNVITNYFKCDAKNDNRKVYKEWNEKVFLEACGIKVKPSKYEYLEKRVEVLEQEVKKSKPESGADYIKEVIEKYSTPITKEWLDEVFGIPEGLLKPIPHYKKGRNKGEAEMIITDHIDKEKSKEERVKYYAKVSDSHVQRQIKLPEPLNFEFSIDWGKPDSHNDVFERNSIKFPVQDNSYQRYLDSLELFSLRQENTKLKLRVEELEAVNAEILKGDCNFKPATIEELQSLPLAGTDVKLEVGNWYFIERPLSQFQNEVTALIYFEDKKRLYGFDHGGKWCVEYGNPKEDNYKITLATESEVLEALTKEAVKRGYEEKGIDVLCLKGVYNIEHNYTCSDYHYAPNANILYFRGFPIFVKGEWAEISHRDNNVKK